MDYSIEVSHVSKQYWLGSNIHSPYSTLREVISNRVSKLLNPRKERTESITTKKGEELWALKDVSFSAKPGEVIGIVGKNGAGKSTLLKILSRISEPTQGSIQVRGKLSSLLEIGTGFHPELSGRENVFLNGAILGMRKEEIKRKFDEIVAFSQLEKFIDTPVKRYSSGMYVRLAFSVAAHLEPDILVLDEVLAVGDLAFQKKCTDVMRDVAGKQRTVLLVSHNLHLIRTLCDRVIVMNEGRILEDGPTERALPVFVKLLQPVSGKLDTANLNNRSTWGTNQLRIKKVEMLDSQNKPSWIAHSGASLALRVEYETLTSIDGLGIIFVIKNPLNGEVITTVKEPIHQEMVPARQTKSVLLEFPKPSLRPGEYSVEVHLGNPEGDRNYDWVGRDADLPFLTITSEEKDPQKRQGYFSLPAFVKELG